MPLFDSDTPGPTLQDVLLQTHSYNVLLHLCAGGNQSDGPGKRVMSQQAEEVGLQLSAIQHVSH